MGRKRTKDEALERIDDLPTINLPYHSKVPGIAHAANKAYETGKTLAKGLVMLDPLGRLADEVVVVPYDMIAIPAHEYFRLNSDPTFQIYIRGGETIMPTGGNVRDVQEVVETMAVQDTPKRKKKTTAYQRKYKKAFAKVKPKHMNKNGKWKKGGFKAAVKAAHRMCK
jgi:hypothetical protein